MLPRVISVARGYFETNKKTDMTQQELLDDLAKHALQALILKAPFFDRTGEIGIQVTQDELTEIKKGLCETAYEYAGLMLVEREKAKKWLEENQSNGHFLD